MKKYKDLSAYKTIIVPDSLFDRIIWFSRYVDSKDKLRQKFGITNKCLEDLIDWCTKICNLEKEICHLIFKLQFSDKDCEINNLREAIKDLKSTLKLYQFLALGHLKRNDKEKMFLNFFKSKEYCEKIYEETIMYKDEYKNRKSNKLLLIDFLYDDDL